METTLTPQNEDADGDVVGADENSLSNSITTPVASRAIIQDVTTTSTTPEASASLLSPTSSSPNSNGMLREWTAAPNLAQFQHIPNISSPMPPVAPAVLLIQREESSNSTATVDATATRTSQSYHLPVATVLTNWARSVSENVRNEIGGYIPPNNMCRSQINIEASPSHRAIVEAPATVTTENVDGNCVTQNTNDVNSDNNAVPIISVAPSQATPSTANARSNGRSNLSAEEAFEDQTWTMVNGELVCIDYSQEEDLGQNQFDTRSMGHLSRNDLGLPQKDDRRISKSTRIQRGVRKLKKLRKIFSGKGERNKITTGESTRRKQRETQEKGRYQQENPSHSNSHEFRNYDSTELIELGGVGALSITETANSRLRTDTASDGDNESGDGGSLIEAPNAQNSTTFSHHTTLTGISNISNNGTDENSTFSTRKFHSEEFSTRTGSIRSTHSSHPNTPSSNSSNSNQVQKKKIHRLPRWLRGNRDQATSTDSIQNQPRDLSDDGFSPTPPMMNDKPAAREDENTGGGFMPPLREELSSNSAHRLLPSSLMAESPLHAPPIAAGSTGDLYGVPFGQHDNQRSTSIAAHADFVCHADSITSEAALLPQSEYYIEARLDDYDKYDEKSMKGMKNSMKVDKQMGPSIDIMLERAGEIATSMRDEDIPQKLPPTPTKSGIGKGKSDGESVPLSMANPDDDIVHNDTLKLVLVGDNAVDKSGLGRLLRKSTKKPRQRTRLAVDVHSWMPSNAKVRFTMWEVITSKSEDPYLPNFGARPGTQSLFFSDQSLYLLAYDLGASNPQTLRHFYIDSDDEGSDDEWDEHHNCYLREEANRKADRALEADIKERVLSWVDCIARRGSHSAILPIALLPQTMSTEEAERRLRIMKTVILNYEEKLPSNIVRPKILCNQGTDDVVWVSLENNINLEELERMILDIADASHNVFHHVGRPVPPGTVEIMNVCRSIKKTHKMILVDHLIAKLPNKPEFSAEAVMEVLYFLSTIGELLYFGDSDSMLKDYVILCRKWLVGALSCILRNDLQRELSETRDFFRFQAFYSDHQFPESNVTQTFSGNNSSCPILSCQDTQMLWQSANFMMEAVDQSSQSSENLTTTSTMFDFLQHLLEHTGVFLPLEIDRFSSTDRIYFVPSLLSQASSRDVWTYKSSEAYMVTLCHSWLFRDGAPSGLMEQVTVALLRDLYESSHANAETPTKQGHKSRSNHVFKRAQTFPFREASLTNYMDSNDGEPLGQIKIHQINCWKNSLLLKIGRIFPKGNELYESIAEIFVAVIDQVSPHSVASDSMRSNMQRLVVSGKGEVGLHGHKLWKGGYNVVLDSIKASVANCSNVERQVVCPECLSHRPASSANTWSLDSVRAVSGHTVRCMMGHKVDRNLISGTFPDTIESGVGGKMGNTDKKPVKDLFPSVVVVGLWNHERTRIENVGSGFIANKKLGLVVTAGHILFDMDKGSGFGAPYKGLGNASAIIGVIPSGKKNNTTAIFRYFAEIVAHDIHNMDTCILKITSRLENDVHNHTLIGNEPTRPLESIQDESLSSLKITSRYEIEQAVRIIGFNQGGEGRLEVGKHVNRTLDFAKGYICKQFKMEDDESTSSDDSSSSEEGALKPREEIVVMCDTIQGHSGGPCVNDDGKVVGILSRSDPANPQRCYVVPSSEIKILISQAKRMAMGYSESQRSHFHTGRRF